MTNEITLGKCFVTPVYYEELGGEGLSLHQIAESLDAEFRDVKKKFEKMKDVDIIAYVEISAYIKINTLIGFKEIESYVLNTQDAKFFVARYQSKVGNAYLRFLLDCEQVVLSQLRAELAKHVNKSPYKQLEGDKVVEVPEASRLRYKIQQCYSVATGCLVNADKYARRLEELQA
jgi:hypothetical protein